MAAPPKQFDPYVGKGKILSPRDPVWEYAHRHKHGDVMWTTGKKPVSRDQAIAIGLSMEDRNAPVFIGPDEYRRVSSWSPSRRASWFASVQRKGPSRKRNPAFLDDPVGWAKADVAKAKPWQIALLVAMGAFVFLRGSKQIPTEIVPDAGVGTGETGADGVRNSSFISNQAPPLYKGESRIYLPPSAAPYNPVLVFPVDGAQWGRGFGYQGSTWHPALDIGAKEGTIVRAVADGKVWKAAWDYDSTACGNQITAAHKDPNVPFLFNAGYCHLSDIFVSKGDMVKRGQPIGRVGWSGNVRPKSTKGSHLHFFMYVNWPFAFDPAPWIGKRSVIAA